jgi:hypothetical protein
MSDELTTTDEKNNQTAIISDVTEFGTDLDLLKSDLSLSLEERLLQHHAAFQLLIEIERARSAPES